MVMEYMEYRKIERNGDELSLLGFGIMRLNNKDNSESNVKSTKDLIKYAVDNGINYLDTAYLYGNGSGSSEKVLGQVLEELNYRSKVFISTKMNRMIINSKEDMDRMFEEELKNLRTDYIDYYFIHNVISYQDILNLKEKGLFTFIEERKEKGQIINMGFSYHGSYNEFVKIIDEYEWDMTLLQYNYLDTNMQAGSEGIQLAHEKGMGVIIMEPLKGGLLAGKMPKEAQNILDNSSTDKGNIELALQWVYNNPNVTCVLSGMTDIDMLKENIEFTDRFSQNPLTDEEIDEIADIRDVIKKSMKINCTSCEYCLPCPKGVSIPDTFTYYNDKHLFPENRKFMMHNTTILYYANILGIISDAKDVSLCVDCGLCSSKCPQQLEIPKLLRQADKSYHGNIIRPLVPLFKKIMNRVL